jgi:drug/metabolite transporter (DMT)-like permease
VRRSLPVVTTGRMHLHVLRALAGLVAMYCYFYTLAHMKLAEAVLLSYTSPLIIPVIALVWLHEPMGRRVRTAIVIGFAGVLLLLKPGCQSFSPSPCWPSPRPCSPPWPWSPSAACPIPSVPRPSSSPTPCSPRPYRRSRWPGRGRPPGAGCGWSCSSSGSPPRRDSSS